MLTVVAIICIDNFWLGYNHSNGSQRQSRHPSPIFTVNILSPAFSASWTIDLKFLGFNVNLLFGFLCYLYL